MTNPVLLIAGSGIGGLSAALALWQRGFDVDVYEQAPRLEEVSVPDPEMVAIAAAIIRQRIGKFDRARSAPAIRNRCGS
jgi:2-polyprenyl-6-methoxyphenol hydroxylase-like FAD-dependent oxidoreductase